MLDRWLPRLDALALWFLGIFAGAVVDLTLSSTFELSPVLANPLRGPHPFGPLDLVGWLVLGAAVPTTLALARLGPRLHPLPGWTLAMLAPACGLALAWHWGRGWSCAWLAVLSVFSVLVLPLLERSRAISGWRSTWCMSLCLIVVFLEADPAHGVARRSASHALWWIGVAGCGAGMSTVLWRAGLRLTATASTVFWACALWSLVANAREISKCSVGLLSVVWRSHVWLGRERGPLSSAELVWPSVPALGLLLLALHYGPGVLASLVRRTRPLVVGPWTRLRQGVCSRLVRARHEPAARPSTGRPAPRLEARRASAPGVGRGGA